MGSGSPRSRYYLGSAVSNSSTSSSSSTNDSDSASDNNKKAIKWMVDNGNSGKYERPMELKHVDIFSWHSLIYGDILMTTGEAARVSKYISSNSRKSHSVVF